MGCGSLKKENNRLKEANNNLNEKMEAMKEKEKELLNRLDTLENTINQNAVDLSPEYIQQIMTENANLKEQNENFKNYCKQLELILSMRYQEIQNYRNLLGNKMNPMNSFPRFNNNNSQNNQKIYTIIFKLENGAQYPVPCYPKSLLGNIFLLLLNKIMDYQYCNIYNLQFFYMAKNITNHFLNNVPIETLSFTSFNPIIEIRKK